MKTIKILLVLLVFLAIGSNAQPQTKEETISWLKDKLGKYMVGHDAFPADNLLLTSIDECSITFSYSSLGGRQYIEILPTNVESISTSDEGAFDYNAKVASKIDVTGDMKEEPYFIDHSFYDSQNGKKISGNVY